MTKKKEKAVKIHPELRNPVGGEDILASFDEDLNSKESKRMEKLQKGKIQVHFSIPNPLARLLDKENFPEFHKGLYFTLSNSKNDNDSVLLSRSIPLGEIKALKEFVIKLEDESIKKDSRGLLKQLTSIIELVVNGKKRKVGYLRNFPAALYAFMMDGYIDGWLYRVDSNGNSLPYLVTEVEYRIPRDPDSKPYVVIEMTCYSKGVNAKSTITIHADDIRGRTMSEVLYSQNGLLHESKQMKTEHTDVMTYFHKYQAMPYAQFKITGSAKTGSGWSSQNVNVVTGNVPYGLALNDEPSKEKKTLNLEAYNWFWIRNFDAEEEDFKNIPVHPFVYMFHLGLHCHMYVSAKDMVPYEYNTNLGEKLVLPESHKELISILTEDQDILIEDIIEGKGGGTIILCKGIPGVGKTLSAQVYAEIMKKPLYNVNAGDLGININDVEKNLKKVMRRAEVWGAVLLIDEADVYIRARGEDVHHNALVAVWLRTIEYFNGLMFLTTNRGDDVDDAIVSRCIATISYRAPEEEESIKIWKIMCDNAGLSISDAMAKELTATFPNSVGRDIEKLVKLTMRYTSKKEIEANVAAFVHCAAFRGMVSTAVKGLG